MKNKRLFLHFHSELRTTPTSPRLVVLVSRLSTFAHSELLAPNY